MDFEGELNRRMTDRARNEGKKRRVDGELVGMGCGCRDVVQSRSCVDRGGRFREAEHKCAWEPHEEGAEGSERQER
jgi:hypothetical protein